MRCGLLGRKLGHSYSPQIHSYMADYTYTLFEREPEALEAFLSEADFDAINITIPYKKAVIPFCDALSDTAKGIGAVNTVVKGPNGRLTGHNTDYFGFLSMVRHSGLDLAGKKVLVLGSGGASRPVLAVLERLGADPVIISHRDNTPQILRQHADASVIVNATPVGMFPEVGTSPVDLDLFANLEGVLDLIYNPARTQLLLDAERRGLIIQNGLWMLVAQAKEASEWFTGRKLDDCIIETVSQRLLSQTQNIVLVGMPGCGKTTVGTLLAQKLSRQFVDADEALVQGVGRSIPDIFAADGEEGFRILESGVLADLGKRSGLVIATGGGCVTKEENYPLLHQNGVIIWLQRDLKSLATEGRPLSQQTSTEAMYARRKPMYERFADLTVTNCTVAEETAEKIIDLLKWR